MKGNFNLLFMDIRIEQIFHEEMSNDTSFKEKLTVLDLIFGKQKYSSKEMRETWHLGIKHGIEIGLRKASLEGQKVELINNTASNPNHLEFIDKFYQLAKKYKCAIQYHPKHGMVIISREI